MTTHAGQGCRPAYPTIIGQPEIDISKPETDDQRYWSVTTIIGCLDKPALLYWAAQQAADAAVAVAGSLSQRIEEEGAPQVAKWLRDARFRQPRDKRSAAELGTAVHAACESYALNGVRPEVDDEVQPYLDQFDGWCQIYQPVYEAVEMAVYSPTYGYAGTCDAFLSIDGVRFIADYKTSAKSIDAQGKVTSPYPEVALQLAAYRHAEMAATWRPRRYEKMRRRYYLLGDAEKAMSVPVPEVDAGLAIHITPDHCDSYVVRTDEEVHRSFLYCLEIARWTFEVQKTVIGDVLVPGEREVG